MAFSVLFMGAQIDEQFQIIRISIAFEPIILLLGIQPKEVNKIVGRFVNNEVHCRVIQ